jgi:hypothetical protein
VLEEKFVANPRVPIADIAREMTRRHPDRALPMLLWLTRDPSFGLVGPKELGVPPDVFGGQAASPVAARLLRQESIRMCRRTVHDGRTAGLSACGAISVRLSLKESYSDW